MSAVAEDFEDVHLPLEVTIENHETLLLLLASTEPNVLMPVVSTLRDKIPDESVVKATIPRIVELAAGFQNEQLQIVLAWYLSDLAVKASEEKWAFDILSSSGAVPYLVKYAKDFDAPATSEKSFEALVSLTADPVTAKEIEASGALEVFIEALKKDDPTIQSQVALALSRLSEDFESRRSILESGLFLALLEFLENEDIDEEIVGSLLQAVSKQLLDNASVVFFEEQMAWKYIIPFMDDADKAIQNYAYAIVATISEYEAFRYHFDDELLQRFINALTDLEEFDPAMLHLITILRNCCSVSMVAKSLALQVPLLVDRIFSEQTDQAMKITIIDTIARLAQDANTHSSILEPEQLSRICKLLAEKEFRKYVLMVLSSVCENRSIRAKLHEFGAIDGMLEIMHETEEIELQSIVLPIIFKIIGDAKLQQLIIERSIPDLALLITSEYPDIQNAALLIIATIAVDAKSRATIATNPEFLGNMIKLINSKKVAIRRNSLHAINSLAVNPEISVHLCEFGIIERLRKFASSSRMINKNLSEFASTALSTICSTNLVAKYWVNNVLNFDDELYDGFYSIDPRIDTYKSLDSLLNDVIHLRLEVLLLDASKDSGLEEAAKLLSDSFVVKNEAPEPTPSKKKGKKQEANDAPQQSRIVPVWPHIAVSVANFVINRMGGPFQNGRIQYESEVSRCKYKTHSDVVMLGQLNVGTIRHRALLFKYLASKYEMQAEIIRNPQDLNCAVKVKKNDDVYTVDLSGTGEVITKV